MSISDGFRDVCIVRRSAWTPTVLTACLLLGGCATQRLEDAQVHPKNRMNLGKPEAVALDDFFGVPVEKLAIGPVGERIAFAVVPPRAYGFKFTAERPTSHTFSLSWETAKPRPTELLQARGTVVLLHGYSMDMSAMSLWAGTLAQAGYVALLVDLPGFGSSNELQPDYGAHEAEMVAKLIGKLREDGRLPSPLSVLGVSLGGMEALRVAALVPDVRGTWAFAPMLDLEASTWATVATDAPFWVRWVLDRKDVGVAMKDAENRLHVPLLAAHHEQAVGNSSACTLLVRGTRDKIVSEADVAAYVAVLRNSQTIPMDGFGHESPFLRIDWLGAPVISWLDSLGRGPESCSAFVLPPDPLPVGMTSSRS